ncbi:MAG: hypothetical protein V5A64_04070 [Candidatus Thermoplasmatota archaeon]
MGKNYLLLGVIISIFCILIPATNTNAIDTEKFKVVDGFKKTGFKEENMSDKRKIKIGFMVQTYDWMDVEGLLLPLHKNCLIKGESWFDVEFEIVVLEDSFNSGDVHSGALEDDFDVVVGPGGFGSWCTSSEYREKIKVFIENGGGYYGICGDSTFGGFKPNVSEEFKPLLKKLFGIEGITEMLGVANVRSNVSVFYEIISPENFTKLDVGLFLMKMAFSRAKIKFLESEENIHRSRFNQTEKVMLGNVPLEDAGRKNMADVSTLAVFNESDRPYPPSIVGQKAMVATTYGEGRVVLSAPHPELTLGNKDAQRIYIRNLLWAADAL